jgi:hypothetical protein
MVPWIAVVVSLIGGGAVGAVISAIVSRKRDERQPAG